MCSRRFERSAAEGAALASREITAGPHHRLRPCLSVARPNRRFHRRRGIADNAARAGAEVPFVRPPQLARDSSPKWPVFRHLVENYERLSGNSIDVLVDLDIGVPLRQPIDVEACVAKLRSASIDVVTTAYLAERNPYFNMVEVDADGWAHISKPPSQPISRRQDAPAVYSLSPAVFAIRRDVLWACEHWSQARLAIHVMPRERAVDIDTEVDYRLVESLWICKSRAERPFHS